MNPTQTGLLASAQSPAAATNPEPAGNDKRQRHYQRLVLMSLQHLMQKQVFTALLQQLQNGDAGQAIGGAVVQILQAQQRAAQQAGIPLDNSLLSAASIEVATRLAEALQLLGIIEDAQSVVRDAVEYGQTLTASPQAPQPAPQEMAA